jgi:hypothetical protein
MIQDGDEDARRRSLHRRGAGPPPGRGAISGRAPFRTTAGMIAMAMRNLAQLDLSIRA